MKPNKIIGILFFVFAGYTVVGMKLNSAAFWSVYNYVTLVFSIVSGIVLIRQK